MSKMTVRARTSEFLIAVSRIRLSQMIRDPFVAAAFRAAEDDGLATSFVDIDHPKVLDGGATEVAPSAGRHELLAHAVLSAG